MFSCAGSIASPHILPWSCPSGEGGLPIRPSFLVPAGFLSRTYSHDRACPARAIGAVPLFREYVFLSSYKTVFAVPSNPVMPVRQKGSPVSVHVFLCRKDCLPHILLWSRLPGKGHRSGSPFSGMRLSFLIQNSIRRSIQTSHARPAKGISRFRSCFLVPQGFLPHILSWSRLPGEDCVHYTIFLIAAAPSKAETLGRRFSPRAAAKNPLHCSL